MNKLIRLKHWRLFFILIGPLLLLPFTIVVVLSVAENEDLAIILTRFFLTFFVVCFFSWLWTIGINLNRKLPENSQINLLVFKLILVFPFLICVFVSLFYGNYLMGFGMNYSGTPLFLNYFRPLSFFSFLSVICSMFFIAVMLNVVEKKEEAKISHFIFDSILFIFWPIGLWLIQPRINHIFFNERKAIEEHLVE